MRDSKEIEQELPGKEEKLKKLIVQKDIEEEKFREMRNRVTNDN